MDKKKGHSLKIVDFRSIDELELLNIPAFAVFAGANGSGKSNFFDALYFASLIVRFDNLQEALKRYGGEKNIQCTRRDSENLSFQFEMNRDFLPEPWKFSLEVKPNESSKTLRANYGLNGKSLESSHDYYVEQLKSRLKETINSGNYDFVKNQLTSFVLEYKQHVDQLRSLFNGVRLYRIDPSEVKQPGMILSNQDDSELQSSGGNIATVLRRLENDEDRRETIVDWLQCVVPEMDLVEAKEDRLTGVFQLEFKEAGTDQVFPAHLVSDGTIYLLCLLIAVLDRPTIGLTLIEEPERGLHPSAMIELIQALRELATDDNPIWLTTHSETVVRMLKDDELWLVDKVDGKTQMKQVTNVSKLNLSLDQAWLCNVLNGGLPW